MTTFVVVYSLILATIFTLSVSICSCSYCFEVCRNNEETEEMPESVRHMYS